MADGYPERSEKFCISPDWSLELAVICESSSKAREEQLEIYLEVLLVFWKDLFFCMNIDDNYSKER